MTPVILAAGEESAWFNMSGFVGGDVVLTIKIGGSGVAAINVSCDESDAHTDEVSSVESFSSTTVRVLQAPLPDYIQIKNTAGSGTVTFALGRGVQQVTDVPPPTE